MAVATGEEDPDDQFRTGGMMVIRERGIAGGSGLEDPFLREHGSQHRTSKSHSEISQKGAPRRAFGGSVTNSALRSLHLLTWFQLTAALTQEFQKNICQKSPAFRELGQKK